MADVLDLLHRLAALSEAPLFDRDNLYVDTDAVRRLSRQIKLEESFGQVDHDGWEARLVDLVRDRGVSRTRKGSGHKYGKHALRTEVLAARDALFAALQQFKRDADGDLAACLQQELAGATSRYQDLKSAAGVLDFGDLLAKARDLIKSNDAVRRHLQGAFTRIFVDEFQDTDPIQAEILLLLAGGQPGKLFIVGDPKQAIYRFRGTDVETYWRVRDQLGRQGGRTLQLTTSYRSVPPIQRFVNAAFERHMVENRQTLQAGYVPLAQDRGRTTRRSRPSSRCRCRSRTGGGASAALKASAKAIEESLPDAIGAFIAWLTDDDRGWTVAERGADGDETRVPLEARHIAILFRRFTSFGEDVTRPYVDAIEARGIPHLLVGGKAFHGREEVEAVRAVLAAIEWPDDELSTFAALKGPLFAIDDEHLFEFKSRFHAFHPFRVPPELGGNSGQDLVLTAEPTSHLMPIADALRLLQQLHRGRNYRPVADTIGRLLEATRAHVGLILRPAGEQALANVLHIAELARQYEAGGGISFRGFIDELQEAARVRSRRGADSRGRQRRRPADDRPQGEGARVPGRHPGGPDVPHEPQRCQPPSRSRARAVRDPPERMGAARAPRSRGRGSGARRGRGHPARVRRRDAGARSARRARPRRRAVGRRLAEPAERRALSAGRSPALAGCAAPKCPAFKSKDTVLERPNDETATPSTVCPGQHDFAGGYSVVWWDPGALTLGLKPAMGVRRDDLIVKDVARDVVADGRTKYDAWKLARINARERGSVPTHSGEDRARVHARTKCDAHGRSHRGTESTEYSGSANLRDLCVSVAA